MINCQSITYNEATVCIIENKYSTDALLSELDSLEYYQNDLKKLKTDYRKKEFLAIRLALKKALGGQEKEIIYTSDGKPQLKDSSYKISFSHCQSCVGVIVHPTLEVGIDVEAPSKKLMRIHTRFLGKEELEYYQKTGSFDFLRIAWSVKEALYKIIGKKAYNFAGQLRILPFEIGKVGTLHAIHNDTNKKYKLNYFLNDSYTLAYCIDDE